MGTSPFGRFTTWDLDGSLYQHQELAANWITLDNALGTLSGAGSVYSEISALKQERSFLGEIKQWYRFNDNFDLPTGWVVCDGRVIGPNDLKDRFGAALPESTPTPDLRNKFILGADSTKAANTAAVAGNASANAPGIGGAGGTNAAISHSHTLPDHHHEFSHIHEIGPLNSGGFETGSVPTGFGFLVDANTSNGTTLTLASHRHHIDIFSSVSRPDDWANTAANAVSNSNSNNPRQMVSKQRISTGGTATNPTGGTSGENIVVSATVDARPQYVGVLFVMKVKHVVVT